MKFGGLSSTGAQHGCRAPPTLRHEGTSVAPLALRRSGGALTRLGALGAGPAGERDRRRGHPSVADGEPGNPRAHLRRPGRRQACAGPGWTYAGTSSSRTGPSVASGRGDWSEMDAIVPPRIVTASSCCPSSATHQPGRPTRRALGVSGYRVLSRPSSRPPCAAIRRSRPGSSGTSQTSACSPSRTPIRPGSLAAAQRTSGAGAGGVGRQADLGRPRARESSSTSSTGSTRWPASAAWSSSTGWGCTRTAPCRPTIRAPG